MTRYTDSLRPRYQRSRPWFLATPDSSASLASGTGYVVGDTGTITGGTVLATYVVDTVDGVGGVLTFHLTNPGAGYTPAVNVATVATSGVGTGFAVTILTVDTTTPAGRPIVRLYDFIRQDGTIRFLAIVRGTTGNNQLYNRGTFPWTLIGTLGTKYEVPDILTFTNLALIANGYEVPYSYDLTTLKHLVGGTGTVPAGAKHHALHQGFYWVWNTGGASGVDIAATLTTALAGANDDLTYTANTPGTAGNAISVTYVNDGVSQALSVTVVGNAITVHLATDGGGVPISTAAQVGAAVNADASASALVNVVNAPGNNGSGVPSIMAQTSLSGGATPAASFDGPSSLRSSDLNNPNSWPLANQIFIDKDDGDQGMGLGQFTIAESGISPTTSQILFKTFSAFQMTGVFGSTTPLFTIQRVKSDMGCIAARTIRFAPGFGLIRLTHRGFALFDGVNDLLISEAIRPLIFGSSVYEPIDWTQASTAYACVVPNPPVYLCAVPLCNQEGLRRVFCYDLIRQAWTILEYPEAIATLYVSEVPGTLGV